MHRFFCTCMQSFYYTYICNFYFEFWQYMTNNDTTIRSLTSCSKLGRHFFKNDIKKRNTKKIRDVAIFHFLLCTMIDEKV